MLIVVSGPSAVGKNHLITTLSWRMGWHRLVPVTTRTARPNETDGLDYEFLSLTEFQHGVSVGAFQYWDYALTNYYGYRHDVHKNSGVVVIHSLARMALRMRREPNVRLIFLRQSSDSILESRLHQRGLGQDDLLRRRDHWREENVHAALFDVVVEDFDTLTDDEIVGIDFFGSD